MEKVELKLNGKIEFVFEEGDLGVSLIQGIYEGYILATIPMKGISVRTLGVGEELDGFYYQGNNVYMFRTIVLDRVIENIPLYKLKTPNYFKKVQRRNFVRIPISLPIIYKKYDRELESKLKTVSLEGIEEDYKGRWEEGLTWDLSGGGTKLNSDKPYKNGTLLYIIFKYEKLNIGLTGKVVRCMPYLFKKTFSYNLGVEFVDISEEKRDRIIKFIFQTFRERKNLET